VLALLAPGQGSQKPGFLSPWLDHPATGADASARLRWLSTLTGLDLIRLGTEADADEIKDTAKTQPLLVAAGLVAAASLPLDDVAVVAGHSIGELTAAALAGVLSAESAVALAGVRGREMAAACAIEPTGMSAVLGGEPAEVLARLEEYGLTPANQNGAGQVVAAGPLDALEKLSANPPAKARVVALRVAGAFHTAYMANAEQALAAVAGGVKVSDPARLLLTNADGTAVATGHEALNRLVRQVTSPVRWDLCQRALADIGITGAIELAPAGTLAGLAKRMLKGVEVVTLNTPDDLKAALDLIARHGGPSMVEPTVQFHVTVATTAGNFVPADIAEGDVIRAGTAIGHIENRQGTTPIEAIHSGVLAEWLAHPGDPVASGQPLARLHPLEAAR
jgi:[acyl-carrier-protein] S-malonyltransferase